MILKTHSPASLAEWVNSKFSGRCCCKKKNKTKMESDCGRYPMLIFGPCMLNHKCACAPVHIDMKMYTYIRGGMGRGGKKERESEREDSQ